MFTRGLEKDKITEEENVLRKDQPLSHWMKVNKMDESG